LAECLLDQAVFETVISDDDETPARSQHTNGGLKTVFESTHFVIDRDSKSLKDEGRRVVTSTASDSESPNQIDQVCSRLEGLRISSGDDRASQAS
jgi:hypothetical protein